MSHHIWSKWAVLYAEGALHQPLAFLMERHSRECAHCRRIIQEESALWRRIDDMLFTPAEMARTAAILTNADVNRQPSLSKSRMGFRLIPALAGAALVLLMAFNLPLPGAGTGPANGGAIYASSSSSEAFVVADGAEFDSVGAAIYASDSQGAG